MAVLGEDIRRACAVAGLPEAAAIDLELATAEAANNIIIHGYGREAEHQFQVHITGGPAGVAITLTDDGRPIPAEHLAMEQDWSATETGGRGLAIIRACVDELDYSRDGGRNRLRLVRRA